MHPSTLCVALSSLLLWTSTCITAQASCASPPSVANSYVISQSPYNNGTYAAYGCNSKYTLSGSASLLCYNGLWVGTIPACEPINYNNNIYYDNTSTPVWVLVIIGVLVAVFLFTLLALLLWCCCYCLGCCGFGRQRYVGNGEGAGKGLRPRRRARRRVMHVAPLFMEDSFVDEPPYFMSTNAVQTAEVNNVDSQTDMDNGYDANIHSKSVQVYHIDGYLRPTRIGNAMVQTPADDEKPRGPSPRPLLRDSSGETSSYKQGSVDKGTITPKMINVFPNENRKHWKTVSNHVKREESPKYDKFSTVVDSLVEDGKFRKPAKDPRKERPLWMPHAQNVRKINTSTK